MSSVSRFTRLTMTVAVAAALVACGQKPAAQGGPMPAPEVSVVTIAPQRVAITNELPGRVEAFRTAQVRARVAGIVQKRVFKEGSEVKEGQVLFQIDPAQYKASLESAQATLARAQANLTQTSLTAQRYKPLVEVNAVSKMDYDNAVAAQKQAEADVASGKAAVQTASLNLGYATVTSPISGRIGRALVTEGALVGQGDATQLALVQQLDPVYVNVTQSSADLLKLQQAMAAGQLKNVGDNKAKVTLVLENGQPYDQPGKLLFSDVSVDESTGSVSLRAEFPNPKRLLLPGTYVRTKVEQAVDDQALLVPQQAVMRDAGGSIVMVVNAENKVEPRPVKTGGARGNNWQVLDGLKEGDRVIVEGLQKVRPGATVKPVQWSPAGAPAAATGQAAKPEASAQPKAN
ncbi:multidrug transporter [Herbaspirillum rubrisubalbicans]|uniref:Multidrug transporter n=2 Tax=Herbaspirillum rubrisubalbicans TaxID=80842 RepID=A0ABX9BU99_9BURK|nr:MULTISPECIES: efflux RND transporter periplasmic adaptor subunit [Herbaspirillum]NQE51891.1 multidrug transporter [Herbaspirillum rubrisubalbicans]QJP99163.1 MexE family multidrug efflux RND transporter periplasmic adaptor subunit [Herbaspirillum rubrisubalbicans Os34]RAM61303.1 multidrug transporter [Herbaspirillum rubrisubalbicans]RAN43496.1 multidrug transporter [Herbaspirillum rubrisubalbicans]